MLRLIRKRMKGEKGFTLIELLVEIIIIAIPTFLGQRQKAQDAAAKSLVRNAMTAIATSYVDNQTYLPTTITPAVLLAIEPSITFKVVATAATTAAISASATDGPKTVPQTVDYDGTATVYDIAVTSASGNQFGVYVDTAGAGETFVKKIGSTFSTGW